MVLKKMKSMYGQLICQLHDKVNAISNQAEEQIREKKREIVSLEEAKNNFILKNQALKDRNKSLLGSLKEKSKSVVELKGNLDTL